MKIIMHTCVLSFLCLFLNVGVISGQVEAELPDHVADDGDGNDNTIFSRNDCYKIDLVITKNGQEVGGVAEDCIEDYDYKLTIRKTCGKKGEPFGIHCYDQIEVTLGNNQIGSGFFQIDPLGNSMAMFSGNFGDLDLSNLGYPNTHNFIIKITTTCTYWEHPGPPFTHTFIKTFGAPFSFVSDSGNSTYVVSRGIDYSSAPLVEVLECFNDWTPICCNRGSSCYEFQTTGSISHSVINTSESKATISFGGSLSATGKSASEVFQASLNLSALGSYTVSQASVNKISYLNSITLKEKVCGIPGKCIVPGLQVVKHELVEEVWEPNCEGDDVMIEIIRTYLPTSVTWSELCVSDPKVDCDEIQIPTPNKGINEGNNFTLAGGGSDCSGWITLGMGDVTGLSISWEGPGGFTASTFDIDNIEIGEYNYLITNECCEEVSGTVTLCESFNYGEWLYNYDTKEYCREVTCEEITALNKNAVNDCYSMECITPDNIVFTYDGSSCIEEHYHEGQFFGSIISENSSETISYDEFNSMCLKTLYCGEEAVDEQLGFPSYGPWSYDYGSEKCFRSVICFGEQMEDEDYKEPQIEEVYNNTTLLCDRIAYCDNAPITLPPSPPIVNGIWNWSEWEGCTKQVQCSVESGIMIVSGTESFNNWNFNDNTNQCYSDVSCENIWVPGATHNESPSFYGTWNWNSDSPWNEQCRREVYCGPTNSLVYQYTSPNFVPTGSGCPGIPNTTQHYVFCNGVNTFITDCFMTGDDPDTREKKESISKIQVYPNPTSGMLSIKGIDYNETEYQVMISDLAGRKINSRQLIDNSIDLSNLQSGVYMISIVNSGTIIYSNKFIIL